MIDWQLPSKLNISPDLLNFVGDPLLAQLLAQRGITTVEQARGFLDPNSYRPTSPDALPDINIAVTRLSQAIEQQELIWVWGDFDADGQTSTTLLVSMLQDLGAQVRYYIPNRLTESHGIKIPALERILAEGAKLIVTCDTGIAEHKAIATAQATGVDVIVTDHHDLADSLPPAQAVINPKRLPAEHSLRELPGVGVTYKLAQALYQAHHRAADSETLLDLVSLGIVADVARQTGDTRYLLQRGLAVLRQTSRTGLRALIESANLKIGRLTEEHIGFWLAPRLNALGRLGDANLAVELLTTTNLARARIIALQLEALNDRRKLLVDRVVIQALSQLEDTPSLADYNAIVLAGTDWHPGVVGIAANRLSDQYGKPAILIAIRPDGLGRGSARSVPGCDIHQALKTQANLLAGFGGHPLAAGLALLPENLTAFRRGLSAALAGCRTTSEKTITLDLMLSLPQVSMDLLGTIRQLAPFGPGNPPVRLGCTGLKLVDEDTFGKTRSHKRLVVEDESGYRQQVIWWGGATGRAPQGTFDLAFTLSPDDYRGGDSVQLEWIAAREWQPVTVIAEPKIIDWRAVDDTESKIKGLFSGEKKGLKSVNDLKGLKSVNDLKGLKSVNDLKGLKSIIVWAEGLSSPLTPAHLRHQLRPAETLIIWTAPPGHDILQQAIAAVRPQQTILVGRPSPFDTLPTFMKQLMGLIKYALLHQQGEVYLTELAAALGHRLATVRVGVDWLVAQGKLAIDVEEEELLVLRPAQSPPTEAATTIESILNSALAETAAYRKFFREANLASLIKVAG